MTTANNSLYFSQKGNSKLENTVIFDLPAGHSCPFAGICMTKVVTNDEGKAKVVQTGEIRCYAASQEALFPLLRNRRWQNFNALKSLKTVEEMVEVIQASFPKGTAKKPVKKVRIHSSGDFFNEKYFIAWMKVAAMNPDILFYGYTKSIAYFGKNKDIVPSNVKLVASVGSKQDMLIKKYGLRTATIVTTPEQATVLGIPIDHTDEHVYNYDGNFALLVHGTQKASSELAKLVHKYQKMGLGYGKMSDKKKKKDKKVAVTL